MPAAEIGSANDAELAKAATIAPTNKDVPVCPGAFEDPPTGDVTSETRVSAAENVTTVTTSCSEMGSSKSGDSAHRMPTKKRSGRWCERCIRRWWSRKEMHRWKIISKIGLVLHYSGRGCADLPVCAMIRGTDACTNVSLCSARWSGYSDSERILLSALKSNPCTPRMLLLLSKAAGSRKNDENEQLFRDMQSAIQKQSLCFEAYGSRYSRKTRGEGGDGVVFCESTGVEGIEILIKRKTRR